MTTDLQFSVPFTAVWCPWAWLCIAHAHKNFKEANTARASILALRSQDRLLIPSLTHPKSRIPPLCSRRLEQEVSIERSPLS